ADRRGCHVRRGPDRAVSRRDGGHRVVETFGRPIAAPYIENDAAVAAENRDFRAHAVGPESVDLTGLESFGGGDAEIDTGAARARYGSNLDVVALWIDSRADQQLAKPHLDPGRRADPAPADHVKVASLRLEVRAHHQKPVHALRLRADELDALPV